MLSSKMIHARIRSGVLIKILLFCQLWGIPSLGFTNGLNYFFEAHQTENGPDLNSITAIMQGNNGYLWLGTYNGLVRFDGVRYVVFGSRNTSEFVDTHSGA